MKQTIKLLFLFSFIIFCSCSNRQNTKMESVATGELITLNELQDNNISTENTVIQRKVIKEGVIRFETCNLAKTRELIISNINGIHGYISEDKIFNVDGNVEYTMVVRVPAKDFDSFLENISKNVQKFDNKTIKAIDVTEEFIDIEARIKTKKELEIRYMDLLKKASKIDEVLSIEKEIGTLRADIESIEGRLKYLNNNIAFSTLTITFYENTTNGFGFSSKFKHGFQNGWTNVLWFFIGLINLWPFLLIGVTIIIVLKKVARKNKKKKK